MSGTALARSTRRTQRRVVDSAHGSAVAGFARPVSAVPDLPPPLPKLGALRRVGTSVSGAGKRSARTRRHQPLRSVYRRLLQRSKKRGDQVGKTKRGKGT